MDKALREIGRIALDTRFEELENRLYPNEPLISGIDWDKMNQ